MTSRERVNLAINHQEPDRVPFDLTVTVDIYHRLREYLDLPPDREKSIGIWTDVSPDLDFIETMQVDIIYLGLNPPSCDSPLKPDDGLHFDQWGVGRKKVFRQDGSYYFEMVKHPLLNATLQEVKDFRWPDPYDPARVKGVRDKFSRYRSETDKAIIGKFTTSVWEQATYLYGIQSWLEMIATQPEIACAILEKTCEIAIGLAEVGLNAAGDLIDIFRLSGEDLGTQTHPLISPRMYSQYVRPYHQRLWKFIKDKLSSVNPGAKIMLHSCGNVRPFIPSWIEMGLDILDPIQPQVASMQPLALKRDFGAQLAFHGGIDIQQVLPFGSPEDVKRHVQNSIRALAPGGGYIVSPAHNVQSDIPPANMVALRDAVEEFGCYPING